MAKVEPN